MTRTSKIAEFVIPSRNSQPDVSRVKRPDLESEAGPQIRLVRVDQLRVDPANGARGADIEGLASLVASILSEGLIQPIVARADLHGDLVVLAGERRLAAARMAGLVEVPVFVRQADPVTAAYVGYSENHARQHPAAWLGAAQIRRLLVAGETLPRICERTGSRKTVVSRYSTIAKAITQRAGGNDSWSLVGALPDSIAGDEAEFEAVTGGINRAYVWAQAVLAGDSTQASSPSEEEAAAVKDGDLERLAAAFRVAHPAAEVSIEPGERIQITLSFTSVGAALESAARGVAK